MVFSSIFFVLVFLPIVLLIYKLLAWLARFYQGGVWVTRVFLFISSLVFYMWGEPSFVYVLLASCLVNYGFGRILDALEKPSLKAKIVLGFGVALNLGLLGYFKYMKWICTKGFGIDPAESWLASIVLPLGISFFTFQGLSYLVDVYRKEIAATRSFVEFGCYLSMFPQLVAGPIVRYASIEEELRVLKGSENFMDGVVRFTVGLAKKIFIADTLGSVADTVFLCPFSDLSTPAAWVGVICYTLQIYYDFSGYSDMALGLGKMLGFTFPENFNYPYISRSLTEFWKRWHMSLSTWLRDYLYIPLGGNRKGKGRTYFNLFIVFVLCGLWHGANWPFVVWGIYNGVILVFERVFPSFSLKMPRILQHLYTIFIFMMGWVIFRSESFGDAVSYYKALFGGGHDGLRTGKIWMDFYSGDVYLALLVGVICSCPVSRVLFKKWEIFIKKQTDGMYITFESLRYTSAIGLFIVCLLPLFGATYNAFIYFRF